MQQSARLSYSFLLGASILVAAGWAVGLQFDRQNVNRIVLLLALIGGLVVAGAIGIPASWKAARRALFVTAFTNLGVTLGLLAQFLLPR